MANKWTAPLRERDITRQIAREHFQEFDRLIESDVIVVGAGPSGLLCARDLAAAGFKTLLIEQEPDRKSTRLNSSHVAISYAVFCLKKKSKAKLGPIRCGWGWTGRPGKFGCGLTE